MHMALDSDAYQVRQIAVMSSPDDIAFSDEDTGESFDKDTVARIYQQARARTYMCKSCGIEKPIYQWDPDSHGVDLCADCYTEAGLENEHQDGMHDDNRDPHCPMCKAVVA
jgi:hypothetical protein